MKKLLFIIMIAGITNQVKGQFNYFNKVYDDYIQTYGINILETDTGFILGAHQGMGLGYVENMRFVLCSLDFGGDLVWSKPYGGESHEYVVSHGLIKTSDHGLAICGNYFGDIGNHIFLMKFDRNGDSLWSEYYDDSLGFYTLSVNMTSCIQLEDNGFLLAGDYSSELGMRNAFLLRTDEQGKLLWSKEYNGPNKIDYVNTLAGSLSDGFIISTYDYNSPSYGFRNQGLIKVDSEGNLLWEKEFEGYMGLSAGKIAIANDGTYLLGTVQVDSATYPEVLNNRIRLINMDTSGNVLWQKEYGPVGFEGWLLSTNIEADGSILCSGTIPTGVIDFDGIGWIAKFTDTGDSLWMRNYQHDPELGCMLMGAWETNTGGIILTGMSFDTVAYTGIWVQMLDSIGCPYAGCDPTFGLPETNYGNLKSFGIYPNPASDIINVDLNKIQADEMLIYNVLGIKVLSSKIPVSQKEYQLKVSSFSTGVYNVILREKGRILSQGKFIISR